MINKIIKKQMADDNPLHARMRTLQLELDLNEKEIFCSLNFCDEFPAYLDRCQKEEAKELADLFANGSEITSQDCHKARKYRSQAQQGTTPLDSPIGATSIFRKVWNWFAAALTTSNGYRKLGWFTSIRLPLIGANRLVNQYEKGKGFIPPSFMIGNVSIPSSIGGLSYALELFIDISMIVKSMVNPGRNESKNLKTRFINIITKDYRPYRMLNASLWLGINLACFFMTGGTSTILNVCGLSGDVIHEGVKAFIERRRYNKLIKKVENRIAQIDGALHVLHAASPENLTLAENNQKRALQCEFKSLELVKKSLEEKRTSATKTRVFLVGVTTLVLVSMVMIAFSTAPCMVWIGAAIIFNSALSFLVKKVKDTFFTKPVHSAMPKPEENEEEQTAQLSSENAMQLQVTPELKSLGTGTAYIHTKMDANARKQTESPMMSSTPKHKKMNLTTELVSSTREVKQLTRIGFILSKENDSSLIIQAGEKNSNFQPLTSLYRSG